MSITDPFNPPEDYTFDWNPDFASSVGATNPAPNEGGHTTGQVVVSATVADRRFAEYAASYPDVGLPTERGLARLTNTGDLLYINSGGTVSHWVQAS